jgi:hypothetical protein
MGTDGPSDAALREADMPDEGLPVGLVPHFVPVDLRGGELAGAVSTAKRPTTRAGIGP